MNNTELVNALAGKLEISKSEVSLHIDNLVELMTTELLDNNAVALGNLGTLEVQKRNERVTVHPANGKKMLIPPKLVVKFKTANGLKDKLKGLKS
ncbi:MAG: HU family DNA-binding protein [Candidatus Symbiothrix sp.]|jgi:DNA-binding protein HU-beta|nr:HU family DNA-binding protein [Candidatus Symbiothrix sp.]